MKIWEVYNFYINKEKTPSPITDRLIESGYRQVSGGYIKNALEQGVIENRNETPSQWWHLIESYCSSKQADDYFTRQVQCGELLVWMAEVSDSVSKKELNEIVDKVLENKTDRRTGNKIIQEHCYEAIKSTVKGVHRI